MFNLQIGYSWELKKLVAVVLELAGIRTGRLIIGHIFDDLPKIYRSGCQLTSKNLDFSEFFGKKTVSIHHFLTLIQVSGRLSHHGPHVFKS